ncbi:MAG: murein hydrolase activator EnvC family protein [Roseicyclus sp.]
MTRLAALGLTILLGGQAGAQTGAAEAATRAGERLATAAVALAEADGARDRVAALTETLGAYEEALLALREAMRQAALRERAILVELETKRDRVQALLGVLQAIQSAPGPLLLLHPEGPLGTARAGMIVADVTPAIAREAQALRARLDELAALRDMQARAEAQLAAGLAGVRTARAALSRAIAERRDLPAPFAMDAAAMQALLEDAASMDDLAARLATLPSIAPTDMPDFGAARGRLPLPVPGRLARPFGAADAAGIARPGLILASRPRALVTAPWPATVRYAGPLLDYGNVIIIEPETDYLLVMAGLGDLFAEAGQLVTQGAALGLMPGPETGADDLILPEPSAGARPLSGTLCLELRAGGETVDPAEWFALD